jgi:hypothetical protein
MKAGFPLALLLLGCASTISNVPIRPNESIASGDIVVAPVFRAADRWTYQIVDRLDRASARRFTLVIKTVSDSGHEASNGDQFTNEMNPTVRSGQAYEPFIPLFNFPLSPGKTWDARFSFRSSAIKVNVGYTGWRTSRVEGWETVKTPAGEFKAIKITFQGNIQSQWGYGASERGTIWYSPDVRRHVRSEYRLFAPQGQDVLMELVSFSPGH